MRNIIFIAPPAAGKGTVSDYLVKNCGYVHLSTGDLLREEIKSGSALGQEINDIIANGNLVNDNLINHMVEDKLNSLPSNQPFILDGYPRTLAQAKILDAMLVSNDVTNNIVIYLDINLEEATKRILGRVICPNCKRSYNIYNERLKPKVENICDDCGIELEHRTDDNEETFKVRFQSYLENTSPILDYYNDKNLLVRINATDRLEMIYQNVLNAINKEAKYD